MGKIFTLEAFRDHLESTYAALTIGDVQFRTLLALPDDRSDTYVKLAGKLVGEATPGNGEEPSEEDGRARFAEIRMIMHDMIMLFVAPGQEYKAERLLKDLNPTMATYREILKQITEATEPGEAVDSGD